MLEALRSGGAPSGRQVRSEEPYERVSFAMDRPVVALLVRPWQPQASGTA